MPSGGWKLSAMVLVLVPMVTLGFVLPTPLYWLVEESVSLLGGVR